MEHCRDGSGPRKGCLPARYFWAEGRVNMPRVLDAGIDVTAAVAHAMVEHGFEHRDIKPSNIFAADDPSEQDPGKQAFKLADFGSAGTPGSDGTSLTVEYAAPELLQAVRAGIPVKPNSASEVYSVGVILFELTQHAPRTCAPL